MQVQEVFVIMCHRYKYTINPSAVEVACKCNFNSKIFMREIDQHVVSLFPCYELDAVDCQCKIIVSYFRYNYRYSFAFMLSQATRMRIWLIIKFSRECQHLLLCFFSNIVTVTKRFRNG